MIAVVEVPVGKKIMIDESINDYDWFNINFNHRRGWNVDWDDRWDNSYSWEENVPYIMTEKGLKRTDKSDKSDEKAKLKNGKFKMKADKSGVEIEAEGELENNKGTYRYKQYDGKEQIEMDTVTPPAPNPPKPPVKPAERKISSVESEKKLDKVVMQSEKEERHTSFLFLTMGR